MGASTGGGLMIAFALLLLTAENPPVILNPSTPVITRTKWAELPSPADLEALYPRSARDRGVEGRVVMECSVAVDGRLHDCVVTSETPPEEGFGEATLQAASKFRMLLPTDSHTFTGGKVVIPMRWTVS